MIKCPKKKLSLLFVLSIFCFFNTTCKKKIEKYPIEMEGIWYSKDSSCTLVFVIEKSGNGYLSSLGGRFCASERVEHGKVKYKDNNLYIGRGKFNFVSKPSLASQNDSLYAPEENNLFSGQLKKYKTLAEMTLSQERNLYSPFKLYKFVDY